MSPVLFVSVCCVHRAEQPTPNHWTPVPLDTSGTGLASRAWKTAVMRRGPVSWFQVGRVFVNTLFRYVDMNICTSHDLLHARCRIVGMRGRRGDDRTGLAWLWSCNQHRAG